MKSFTRDYLENIAISNELVRMIRRLGEYKGRQELFSKQAPKVLENLRQVAIIQSTESSNRIERITADEKRLKELIEKKATPKNRSEAEIAGSRDVLNLIHPAAKDIPFTEKVVQQMHRDLMSYTGIPGGKWKIANNEITEIMPDGRVYIRCKTVEPYLVPEYMEKLHKLFNLEIRAGKIDPLILIPLYVLDFLCIHPFSDGNGRLSRLLTLLLLYQNGYEVGRYVSLEKINEKTKESYYETLQESSIDWFEGKHDPLPWMTYFLSVLLSAYDDFEKRADILISGKGTKTDMVINAIENFIGDFSISDIEKVCPLVSKDMIRYVLKKLQKENRIECITRGRYAKYRKLD
jgi:Fic family protein